METRFNIHPTFLILLALLLVSCYKQEKLNVPIKTTDDLIVTELDEYINDNFVQKYGVAVRYKFVDNYLSPGLSATPPDVEAVRPMLDVIEKYWFEPYLSVTNGEAFFKKYVPAEIVFIGGLIYQGNSVLLGFAESGTRITLLDVNSVDPDDRDWILYQLGTVYHEFAHIVHEKFKYPTGFEDVTATTYTSPGSWYTITDEDALERGFVSAYGSSQVREDYSEIVAHYLFDPDFHENFTIEEENCETAECERRNEGKVKIRTKLALIADHYEKVTGINFEELRAATQAKIAEL